ncbi:tetratricopeptide repeat protein [Ekhidna sp.]
MLERIKTSLLVWSAISLLNTTPVLGQSTTDSLRQLLSRNPTDTLRIDALNHLSEMFYNSGTDTSVLLAKQAAELSTKIDYKKGLATAYHNFATNFLYDRKLDSALSYYEKALKLRTEINDIRSIANTVNNLGVIYYVKNNYAGALYYYQKSLKLKLELGDSLKASSTLNNIGNIYGEQEKHDLALKYYNQSLEIKEKQHEDEPEKLSSTLNNIGATYQELKEYSKALIYLERAFNINLLDSSGTNCEKVTTAINIGICYRELNELEKGLEYLNLAYIYGLGCDHPFNTSLALLEIAKLHRMKGMISQAENEMIRSYEMAESHDLKVRSEEASKALYELYKEKGNVTKAFEYLEIATQLKNELFDEDLTEQLTTMELNYQFEIERDSLEHQKQAELLTVHAQLENQRFFKNLIILGLIVAIAFLFIIYRNFLLKKSANGYLIKKNELQREKLNIEEEVRKQLEIENNQKARSLTATSLQLLNLNEKIAELSEEIEEDQEISSPRKKTLIKELGNLRNEDNQWDSIKLHFENVHPDFFKRLDQSFTELSTNDYKLLAFLKMKLSNKEIALILNVTTRAVEQSKRRLKKKLEMASEDNDILGFVEHAVVEGV